MSKDAARVVDIMPLVLAFIGTETLPVMFLSAMFTIFHNPYHSRKYNKSMGSNKS
jgi:hypothetical protein